MSLESTDQESAAVAVAPRVSLQYIKDHVHTELYVTADQLLEVSDAHEISEHAEQALKLLTICVLVTDNGFTVIGKSAPAAPENFDEDLGRKFAYEDGVRQLWPLYGFLLRDRLHSDSVSE